MVGREGEADGDFRKKLQGRSIDMDEHYLRLHEDEYLREYLKVVDALTINNENRLQRQVEVLTVHKSEIELLKEQVEENKRSQLGLRDWLDGLRKELGIPADKAMVWDLSKTKQGQISFSEGTRNRERCRFVRKDKTGRDVIV